MSICVKVENKNSLLISEGRVKFTGKTKAGLKKVWLDSSLEINSGNLAMIAVTYIDDTAD
jgi:hypothetical protein